MNHGSGAGCPSWSTINRCWSDLVGRFGGSLVSMVGFPLVRRWSQPRAPRRSHSAGGVRVPGKELGGCQALGFANVGCHDLMRILGGDLNGRTIQDSWLVSFSWRFGHEKKDAVPQHEEMICDMLRAQP